MTKTTGDASTAVILVDHGSRMEESNDLLLEAVAAYRERSGRAIVEPAHMELAEPTLAHAFDRCVERGATRVVVFPYFLAPGRHGSEDIPRMAAEAAARHPGVELLVAEPFGLHPKLLDVIDERIAQRLQR